MSCCTQTNGLGALGVVSEDLEALQAATGALKQFADQIKQLWADIEAALGIGAGRREADVIVPYQNEIHTQVLARVGDYLQRLRNNQIVGTCQECSGFLAELKGVEDRWLNYLHFTHWIDGRAAQQAEATLAPIFRSQKDELTACINIKCGGGGGGGGIGPIFYNRDGSLNLPVLAIGAGLLYTFLRK